MRTMVRIVLLVVVCGGADALLAPTAGFGRRRPVMMSEGEGVSMPSRVSEQAGIMGGIAKMGGNTVTATPAKAEPLDGDLSGQTYYQDKLCVEEEECAVPGDDEFLVAVLGDLHLDPRKMEDYQAGREHFKPILEDAKSRGVATALVSLGDLGESKSVRPHETDELFAGTTACHELAAKFLSSFDVPYEVIGGNHDLEGIDEFATDEANLEAMLRIHGKRPRQKEGITASHGLPPPRMALPPWACPVLAWPRSLFASQAWPLPLEVGQTPGSLAALCALLAAPPCDASPHPVLLPPPRRLPPPPHTPSRRLHTPSTPLTGKPTMQFKRQIAEKTLLVGLGSTVFRSAKYTSHEVTIDDEQLEWFEDVVASHPSADGWKIFVFTHAPPIGSGLRVLQVPQPSPLPPSPPP